MLKKSKFIFDFATNFGSNIVILIVGVVGSMLTTRYLGPEGMGSFTIITAFSLLFVSLAELGIRQSSIYFIAKDKSLANAVLSSNFFIWIVSSIIGISLYFILLDQKDIKLPWLWILIGSFVIPSSIANTFINGIMVGVDRISKNATFNFTNSLFKISTTVLFVVILRWSVIGALLALIIPTTTVIFRKYFYLKKVESLKFKLSLDLNLIKQLLLQGFLYAIALFLMTNQKQIPVFVMSGVIPKTDIGFYGVGLTLSGLLYQMFSALAPVIFVKSASSKDPVAASLKIQKLMRVMFCLLLSVSVVLYFTIDYVIMLMYGNKFLPSADVTRVMLFGIVFYNVFLVLNMDMAGKGKPWLAIYTLLPVSLLNYSLNYFFIKELGTSGAAIITSSSMALASLIYLGLYARELRVNIFTIVKPRKSDWDFIAKILK